MYISFFSVKRNVEGHSNGSDKIKVQYADKAGMMVWKKNTDFQVAKLDMMAPYQIHYYAVH